jgi:hypothetical protein
MNIAIMVKKSKHKVSKILKFNNQSPENHRAKIKKCLPRQLALESVHCSLEEQQAKVLNLGDHQSNAK